MAPRASISERLAAGSAIAAGTGCIDWTRSIRRDGYGRIFVGGAARLAHKIAYEVEHGPVRPGLHLDHLCRNPKCINPDHLEPVSPRENIIRGVGPTAINAAKTHCKHGHEFSPSNTYVNGKGNRSCRACNRAAVAALKIRKSRA